MIWQSAEVPTPMPSGTRRFQGAARPCRVYALSSCQGSWRKAEVSIPSAQAPNRLPTGARSHRVRFPKFGGGLRSRSPRLSPPTDFESVPCPARLTLRWRRAVVSIHIPKGTERLADVCRDLPASPSCQELNDDELLLSMCSLHCARRSDGEELDECQERRPRWT